MKKIITHLSNISNWPLWKRNKKKSDDISITESPPASLKEENEKKRKITAENDQEERNYYVSNEKSLAILKRLIKFEKSQKYLKKEITLTWLANHLGTNTKYLSETIRMHRNKNFNNYINGLRINYIVSLLHKAQEYRDYKIITLAEKCGYSSSQVFVIAFKKETGVIPSRYISDLKNKLSN